MLFHYIVLALVAGLDAMIASVVFNRLFASNAADQLSAMFATLALGFLSVLISLLGVWECSITGRPRWRLYYAAHGAFVILICLISAQKW